MDLKNKLFDFFNVCINENKPVFTYFDTTFSEGELKYFKKLLIKCYNKQQSSLGLDTLNKASIIPEERITNKIMIINPNLETYPYKSLKYYFESIINLYRSKFKGEPIDEYLNKTLFCGLFNDDNSIKINYIKGGKYNKRKHTRRKNKNLKKSKTKNRRFKCPKV